MKPPPDVEMKAVLSQAFIGEMKAGGAFAKKTLAQRNTFTDWQAIENLLNKEDSFDPSFLNDDLSSKEKPSREEAFFEAALKEKGEKAIMENWDMIINIIEQVGCETSHLAELWSFMQLSHLSSSKELLPI